MADMINVTPASVYLSNLKWLLISLDKVRSQIENASEVLSYYVRPKRDHPLTIRFRNGEHLLVPSTYVFVAVAETLLMNVYGFERVPSNQVVVDIGASVGDFSLLASRSGARVFAFEPDPETFSYLKSNMESNGRASVRLFNTYANSSILESITCDEELEVGFLKIDCEGCEYEMLLRCRPECLSKVKRVAMEIHESQEYSQKSLIRHLQHSGYSVRERKDLRQGPNIGQYVYAQRT